VIHHVAGPIARKDAGRVIVEVGGIGLELLAPEGTMRGLPPVGASAHLLTHLVVREDAWLLFAFATEEERALFRMLLGVQGVGPRLALAILSGLGTSRLREAVAQSDVAALSTVGGVGKKTAQRLIVDLRDKLSVASDLVPGAAVVVAGGEAPDDAVDALVALGYSRTNALQAVRSARAADEALRPEEVVKMALRKL
jgi:Holliday junction DNA helicase RuvA